MSSTTKFKFLSFFDFLHILFFGLNNTNINTLGSRWQKYWKKILLAQVHTILDVGRTDSSVNIKAIPRNINVNTIIIDNRPTL